MVPQVGQRIGPYEILGRLGSGGMGLVFSAWDARLQRDVAIKLLREEFASPDMRSRFLQEARAASGLNHPNICTIFDIGEQDGDPFLVMELLKGETLRHRMNAGGFQLREIIRVGHEISDALSAAHARSIIHRDIKPANIMLIEKPGGGHAAKVLDFGLAKIDTLGGESIFDLTNTGTTVGTVSYMSPEQARGETLDIRSDLFSVGVILYEMAVGRLPFQGATSALVFVELLSKKPDPIRPQNAAIPEDLEHIILKLLEKDRTLRFQTAAQVMQALEEVPFAGSGRNWTAQPLAVPPPVQPSRVVPQMPVAPSGVQLPAARPAAPAREPSAASAPAARPQQPLGGRLDPPRARTIVPVQRAVRPESSAIHKTAVPEPPAKEAPAPSTMSADEFLRPVRRMISSNESSAILRTAQLPPRESSAVQPVAQPLSPTAPPSPDPVSAAPSGSSSAAPAATPASDPKLQSASYDLVGEPSTETPIPPSRPIVPQSARSSSNDIPRMSLPRVQSPRPAPRFSRIEEVADTRDPIKPLSVLDYDEAPAESRPWLIPAIIAGALALGLAGWKLWPSRPAPIADRVVPIAMAPFQNSLGDNALSEAVTAGLALDLAQSPQFQVNDTSALNAGLHSVGLGTADSVSPDDLRRGAKAMGVTEILSGDIKSNGDSITLGVRVRSVESGEDLFNKEETAQSREQIPDAIDRLVIDLRNGLNEPAEELNRTSLPLAKESTGNLDALQAYAQGQRSLSLGKLDDATRSFEAATTADPHFTQAYLRLADIYHLQHAPLAAVDAAVAAQTDSQGASERTQQLAQGAYSLYVTGDDDAVIAVTSKLLESYPNAIQARIQSAMALRDQGKFPEAFEAVEGALRRSPFNSTALGVDESILLAQNRATASQPVEDASVHAGRPHPGLHLLIEFVNNGEQGPIDLSGDPDSSIALGETQASLLDATGQSKDGLRRWRNVAIGTAKSSVQLSSAASDALTFASIDRALTGDCTNANSLAEEARSFLLGPEALFRSGLSAALCGDAQSARSTADNLSASKYQKSFVAKDIYVPTLLAVAQWKSGDVKTALNTLKAVNSHDLISMAPYLRGQMHLASGQYTDAVADFGLVLQYPGAAVLVNPMLPALSELGLARAYAANHDQYNSSAAYTKFLALWSSADPGSPLIAEANAHSHS